MADAIMGVNFFGEIAPDDFGSYDLAFVTVFSMTAGNSWVEFPCTPKRPPPRPSSLPSSILTPPSLYTHQVWEVVVLDFQSRRYSLQNLQNLPRRLRPFNRLC